MFGLKILFMRVKSTQVYFAPICSDALEESMKKKALFVSLAAMAAIACGCDDSDEKGNTVNCVHGDFNGTVCECVENFTTDASGLCTICDTGYVAKGDTCVKGSGPVDDSCKTTIVYKNSNYKGKPVFLIGDFNNWAKEDSKYQFTENDGTFTLGIDGKQNLSFAKGVTVIFKAYIGGGLEDSEAYHSVPAVCTDGNDHNCKLTISCGQTFSMDEDSGSGNISGGGGGGGEPEECITTFKFHNKWTSQASGGQDWSVYLIGDFNADGEGNWKIADEAYKMQPDGQGSHTYTVKWPKGEHHNYKFYVDGWADDSYKSDPTKCVGEYCDNEVTVSCGQTLCYDETNDGVCNGGGGGGGGTVTGGDICGTFDIDTTSGGNYTINGSDSNAQLKTIKVEGKKITVEFKDSVESVNGGVNPQPNGNSFTDEVPENGKYTYFVKAGGQDVYVPVWVEKEQFDWHNAILYFAFTDRFVNGDSSNDRKPNGRTDGLWDNSLAADWMGGDFKGMQQKVEAGYFDALGVNTIWISSVSMNTQGVSEDSKNNDDGQKHNYTAYHSYWPIASFMTADNQGEFDGISAIEPHFGSMDDLKNLVNACHKRGIRVLVDFAANHVHKDSPMFKKHEHDGWFNGGLNDRKLCDDGYWDDAYWTERCWFSQDLPDINYDNEYVRNLMVQHAIWLIKETNIDGFRVDAVKHMNIQFIRDLRYAVDQLFKNTGIMFYMVGETFTGDMNLLNKYIGDDLLHAQFDFPLYYKIGNVLTGNGLYDAIHNGQSGYKANFKSDLMGTFMGNHDVARAISVAAGQNSSKWGNNPTPGDWYAYDRVMAAWMILLTQPGVPLIYYGDEAGMPGSNDPDNRRMMIFDNLNEQQSALLGFVQSLGKIRRTHKALSLGEREILGVQHGSSDNSTACYKMSYNGESVIVGIGLPDNSGHGPGVCELGQEYTLQNLFDKDCAEVKTSTLDLSSNKFQVWLVK